MRTASLLIVTGLLVSVLACGGRSPTVSSTSVPRGTWGSSQASLTITNGGATLEILASGCVGSYGEITERIPLGSFDVPGIYTQLIGAYPGRVQYAARFSGTVVGHQMTLMVTVPSIQNTFGPFSLTRDVRNTWSACLYP